MSKLILQLVSNILFDHVLIRSCWLNYLNVDVLAMVSAIGSMQNMEIKKTDGSIRDANFLEVMLVDSTLKEGEVSVLCVFVMVFNCRNNLSFVFHLDPSYFLGSRC